MIDNALVGLIRRIRPNSSIDESLPLPVLVGWYLRKGFVPCIRGLLSAARFQAAGFPLFLGKNVTISYASKMRLGRFVSLGSGSVINAFSKEGVLIESGSTIRENAWIQCSSSPSNPGVGLRIGSGTYIGPGAILGVGGPIVIGAECQIGAGFTVIAEDHARDSTGISHSKVTRKGIQIGAGSWIGHRVTIVDGVSLGSNSVVGAGAVVTKSFPAGSTLVGVPARAVGQRQAAEEPSNA